MNSIISIFLSHPRFQDIDELQTTLHAVINRHMYPWSDVFIMSEEDAEKLIRETEERLSALFSEILHGYN